VTKFSANLTLLYTEWRFLDRFARAAEDGFAAVEYVSPYEHRAEEIARVLRDNGLAQALFNLPAGDWANGDRGLAALPERIDEFRRSVPKAIDYALALGCDRLNCLAGILPPEADRVAAEETFVGNLAFAAPLFAEAGIKLLIEPINQRDMRGFFLSTTKQAKHVLDLVGSDNLFIQYDFYHMQVMQGDLIPGFARLQDRIAHVQIADTPGRHEPGTGEINYGFVLSELDRLGYDGWVGCEYNPVKGTREGLGWREAYH
jgi:hydroxypyruvate isomerase